MFVIEAASRACKITFFQRSKVRKVPEGIHSEDPTPAYNACLVSQLAPLTDIMHKILELIRRSVLYILVD